ncbi:MAG: (d)CMP kinase [Gammaproteobacteria bacterium]|nr:(d)CMP kinase [Gammaproteobacteria bacterium]|tara:strand:+ start:11882 stop:12553 length:672 start_codon:yes stop_codon:yes gene_type:complete
MSKVPIITIDGLASSGKTTISKSLSNHLGFYTLDSGILYRAFAYIKSVENIDKFMPDTVTKIINNMKMVPSKNLDFNIVYNSDDITGNLYNEVIGLQASDISKNEYIRDALLSIQHACVQMPGLIANGRDMGTKVFPDAELKIYFTANIEVRAKRRYEQLIKSGSNPNLDNIRKSLEQRDQKDMNRDVSPLKAAKEAIIIDSSELNIETILDKILGLYKISRV